jgi:tripartite-type tricarboxylate transporter receptor subunit TctC
MRRLIPLALLAAAMLAPGLAAAKWPDRQVTIVVPWPAGTGTDLVARVIADALQKKWGATVIVENKSGAAGSIGQAFVAKARPDGYTLIVTTPGPAVNNKLIYKSLPYDPLKDFSFIMRLNEDAMIMIAGPKLAAQNIPAFTTYAKANPGKVSFGNPGIGTYAQMTQLTMQDMMGTTFNLVAYRGAPQMITDLLGKQIDAVIDLTGGYLPQLQSGALHGVAVFGEQRDPRLPDVPTAKEQGLNLSVEAWYGMEGPKGIPQDIVTRINTDVTDILLHDQGARDKMIGIGVTPSPSTPAEFEAQVKAEIPKWQPVVDKYHIQAD